jgi:hypothetical protein
MLPLQVFPAFSIELPAVLPRLVCWRKSQSSLMIGRVKMQKAGKKHSLTPSHPSTGKRGAGLVARLIGFLPFGCWLMVGCSNFGQQTSTGPDPLLGGPPIKATAGMPAKTGGTVATLPAPIPENNPGLSNASLASITPLRGADSNRDLRIGSNTSDPWARQNGPVPRSDGSGAVLRGPEPVTEPVAHREEAVATPVAQASGRIATYEQAQAQLAARGVVWQRLENTTDKSEWQFSCSVPNRQNPRLRRTYQARAADHLSAIKAVLDQIDKDQQG